MADLIEAAKTGDLAQVKEALTSRWWRKPDPNAADKWGCTALHYASENGHRDVVTLLLDSGVAVNAPNRFAHTALHNAARAGHTEIVQLLLERGADTAGHEKQDGSPLNWAIREKHVACVKALLAAGAAVDQVNREGHSAVEVAEIHGTAEIAALIKSASG